MQQNKVPYKIATVASSFHKEYIGNGGLWWMVLSESRMEAAKLLGNQMRSIQTINSAKLSLNLYSISTQVTEFWDTGLNCHGGQL